MGDEEFAEAVRREVVGHGYTVVLSLTIGTHNGAGANLCGTCTFIAMPSSPAAMFAAILAFLLLIADVIFGFVSFRWGGTWALWGPILAIAISWVLAFAGGVFSIFIMKTVKVLCLVYILWFVGLGIWAISQGEWGILAIAVGGFIVNMFVGGFIITLEQAIMKQAMAKWLDESQ